MRESLAGLSSGILREYLRAVPEAVSEAVPQSLLWVSSRTLTKPRILLTVIILTDEKLFIE